MAAGPSGWCAAGSGIGVLVLAFGREAGGFQAAEIELVAVGGGGQGIDGGEGKAEGFPEMGLECLELAVGEGFSEEE